MKSLYEKKMTAIIKRITAITILMLCIISNALSQNPIYENLDHLKSKTTNFLKQQYSEYDISPTVTIKNIDERLKLKKCSQEPELNIKSSNKKFGPITVFVKCTGEKPWSLYIPATVTGYTNILVSAQGVFRGTILESKHLKIQKTDLSKAYYGYYTVPEEIIGMQVSRTIPAGTIINQSFVELPDIIKKGQDIFILASTKGINVQLKGTALMNGKIGQIIKVKNSSSGKTIQGKVISASKIMVALD